MPRHILIHKPCCYVFYGINDTRIVCIAVKAQGVLSSTTLDAAYIHVMRCLRYNNTTSARNNRHEMISQRLYEHGPWRCRIELEIVRTGESVDFDIRLFRPDTGATM